MIPDEYFSKARRIGFCLGVLFIVVWLLTGAFPDFTEHVFSRKIYPLIASALALLGSVLPFSIAELMYVIFILWFLAIPFRQYKQNREAGVIAVGVHIALSFLASACTLLFLSGLTFLFNHHRYTEERLYNLDFELDKDIYLSIIDYSVKQANALSELFEKDERACTDIKFSMEEFDELIAQEQAIFLARHNLPVINNATVRTFPLSFIWSGLGISGQYQYLIGQPNIAETIPTFSKPKVMAHERGHLVGFASEAGANLFASQTLMHAQDARLRYLAILGLWQGEAPETANQQVKADMTCWNDDWESVHRFSFKQVTEFFNDYYLKMSGHEDGVGSYDRGNILALKYYYLKFVEKPSGQVLPIDIQEP